MEKYVNTTWVQAVIDQSLYPFIPGAIIRLWGHDFKIYTNRKLCLRMHNDFVKGEVKAGHVTIMNSPPPGVVEIETPDKSEETSSDIEEKVPAHKEITVKVDLPDFTMDIESYFGHGNMTRMMEALEKLKSSELRSFAKERFQKTFPVRTSIKDIMDEIRTLTDKAIVKILSKEDDEDTDE